MIRLIATAEEARAGHAGTLTEIRRPVEGLPSDPQNVRYLAGSYLKCDAPPGSEAVSLWIPCPLGAPGDLLFVGEAWRLGAPGDLLFVAEVWRLGDGMNVSGDPTKPTYKADWSDVEWLSWKAADFMPRHRARTTLRNLGVRVERVGDVWTWIVAVETVVKDGKPVRPAEVERG